MRLKPTGGDNKTAAILPHTNWMHFTDSLGVMRWKIFCIWLYSYCDASYSMIKQADCLKFKLKTLNFVNAFVNA